MRAFRKRAARIAVVCVEGTLKVTSGVGGSPAFDLKSGTAVDQQIVHNREEKQVPRLFNAQGNLISRELKEGECFLPLNDSTYKQADSAIALERAAQFKQEGLGLNRIWACVGEGILGYRLERFLRAADKEIPKKTQSGNPFAILRQGTVDAKIAKYEQANNEAPKLLPVPRGDGIPGSPVAEKKGFFEGLKQKATDHQLKTKHPTNGDGIPRKLVAERKLSFEENVQKATDNEQNTKHRMGRDSILGSPVAERKGLFEGLVANATTRGGTSPKSQMAGKEASDDGLVPKNLVTRGNNSGKSNVTALKGAYEGLTVKTNTFNGAGIQVRIARKIATKFGGVLNTISQFEALKDSSEKVSASPANLATNVPLQKSSATQKQRDISTKPSLHLGSKPSSKPSTPPTLESTEGEQLLGLTTTLAKQPPVSNMELLGTPTRATPTESVETRTDLADTSTEVTGSQTNALKPAPRTHLSHLSQSSAQRNSQAAQGLQIA